MSVIYITEHNENIYSIGEKESSKRHKKTPKFGKNVEETGAKREKDIKTEVVVKKCGIMGPPNQSLPDPSNFLKKKSKTEAKAKEIHEHERFHCMKLQKLPSIPHLADLKQDKEAKEGKKKNFISENIKYVLSKKPKEPEKRVVIDRYGESKELSRGLEPIHIYSSTFGRTPRYLQQLIKTKERDLQLKKDIYGTEQPKCRYITREERENLLAGLKQNWEELQKQYQGLPILTDTIPKINRKSKMEADLKQLEKDIVLVERHPYIYVYDDDEIN